MDSAKKLQNYFLIGTFFIPLPSSSKLCYLKEDNIDPVFQNFVTISKSLSQHAHFVLFFLFDIAIQNIIHTDCDILMNKNDKDDFVIFFNIDFFAISF